MILINWIALDGPFFNLIEASVRSQIKQVKIPHAVSSVAVNSGTNGLTVRVFLLGGYELGATSDTGTHVSDGVKLSYFLDGGGTAANNKRVAYLGGNTVGWWLRSWFLGASGYARIITAAGVFSTSKFTNNEGIRPCIILPHDMFFSPAANSDGTFSPL